MSRYFSAAYGLEEHNSYSCTDLHIFLSLQACAPLYQWSTYGFSEREPVGTCYLKKGNSIVEYSPCRSSMYLNTALYLTSGCSCPYWVISNIHPQKCLDLDLCDVILGLCIISYIYGFKTCLS